MSTGPLQGTGARLVPGWGGRWLGLSQPWPWPRLDSCPVGFLLGPAVPAGCSEPPPRHHGSPTRKFSVWENR